MQKLKITDKKLIILLRLCYGDPKSDWISGQRSRSHVKVKCHRNDFGDI